MIDPGSLPPDIEIKLHQKIIAKKETVNFLEDLWLLEKEELNDLDKLLSSPFFVSNERAHILFQQFRIAIDHESLRINGGPLLKKLFPKKKYDHRQAERKVAVELRELQRLIHEFIVYQDLRHSAGAKSRVAVMAYKKRKNVAYFQQAVATFRTYLEEETSTIMQLNDQWWLEHQLYFYHSSEKYQEAGIHFDAANRHLRDFYHLTALRYYTECINRSNLVNDKPDWFAAYEKALLATIGSSNANSVVATYVCLIALLKHRHDLARHEAFKAIFKKNYQTIAVPDQLVLIKCAHNAANFALEYGLPDASTFLFFWTRLAVMKKILLFEGMISDGDFLNMALSAAAHKKFDWQLAFMNNYRPFIQESVREKAYYLALSFYHFHQNEYGQAAEILEEKFSENSHSKVMYTLRAKPLLIRCYLSAYLKDFQKLGEFRDTTGQLRKYIERKDFLSEERRAPYSNFIKVCHAIVKFKNDSRNFDNSKAAREKQKIQTLFQEKDQLIARRWLKDVIGGL